VRKTPTPERKEEVKKGSSEYRSKTSNQLLNGSFNSPLNNTQVKDLSDSEKHEHSLNSTDRKYEKERSKLDEVSKEILEKKKRIREKKEEERI
jgi:hypothetical protein